MIKLISLNKKFGEKTAVNIPEFTIKRGEILGLVGNNGAGNTTLFRIMLDLLKADEGNVELTFDNDVPINPAESENWKALTGAYIDDGFLIDFLTPEEYFEFVGKVNGMDKNQIELRLHDFIQFMAGEIIGQKKLIRDYSAGNKQKIGIISTLLTNPQLVVLDEPFNFLDPSSQNQLKKLLLEYNKQTNATILVSSHNLQHTVEISTRIALLEHGTIIKNLPNESQNAEKELTTYFDV